MVQNIWSDFAASYDRVIPKLHCYQRMLAKILRDLEKSPVVIDAGCGSGIVSEPLVQRGHRVVGFDNNPAMLVEAHAKRSRATPEQSARWVCDEGDVLAFPAWVPRDADGLVLNNVLYYVAEPLKTLTEAVAHLRPGAVIVVTGPRKRPDAQKVFREAMAEWQRDGFDIAQMRKDIEHFMGLTVQLTTKANEMVSFFQPDELVGILTGLGFRDVIEASQEDYYGENFYVAMRR
jgi:trans-aconitate methyltransferase